MPGHAPATSGRGIAHWCPAQGQRSPWLGVVVRFGASCGTCQFVPGIPEMAFQPDKHPAGAGHKERGYRLFWSNWSLGHVVVVLKWLYTGSNTPCRWHNSPAHPVGEHNLAPWDPREILGFRITGDMACALSSSTVLYIPIDGGGDYFCTSRMCSTSCTSGLYLRVWGGDHRHAGGALVLDVRSLFRPGAHKNKLGQVKTPPRPATRLAEIRSMAGA
jgi:hypothetical protein